MNGLVYLATPYSHPDKAVMFMRYHVANRVAGRLVLQGMHVFSPISHTRPIARSQNMPHDWSFWREQDEAILALCDRMIVLMQDGWEDSVGVAAEIKFAQAHNIPIDYMEVTA